VVALTQNIDPTFMLEPIIVIAISVGTILYWHRKEGLSKYVLGFSLIAYGGAIAAKLVFQYLTAPSFLSISQGSLWLLGFYVGVQTSIFEVGGAFLVACFAVSRHRMKKKDGVGYGLGLAFWENGILISATSLLSLLSYSTTIAQGGGAAESIYTLLSKSQPQLFYPPLEALQIIAWGVLERISSLMAHLSWGYLCLKSATTRSRKYILIALPMGFIDFLVPFAQTMPIPLFEIVVFMLASLCVLAAVYAVRR
jgi:uncharacterized membrane protein YhfC